MGRRMGDDHRVAARRRLLNRLAEQPPDLVARRPTFRIRWHVAERRPRLSAAASGEFIEQAREERLTALFVRDVARSNASLCRRMGDEILVHVAEPETLRDQ